MESATFREVPTAHVIEPSVQYSPPIAVVDVLEKLIDESKRILDG